MKFNLLLLASLFIAACFSGCAQHKIAEQKIEKEVKEIVIPKNETAAETTRDFIMNSDKLSAIQKTKLLDLQVKVSGI